MGNRGRGSWSGDLDKGKQGRLGVLGLCFVLDQILFLIDPFDYAGNGQYPWVSFLAHLLLAGEIAARTRSHRGDCLILFIRLVQQILFLLTKHNFQ